MFRLMSFAVFFTVVIVLMAFQNQANNPDAIIGSWKTGEGFAIIQIYKNGDHYQGKIIWLEDPNDPETGKPKLDKKHPDAKNHNRPLIGLINLWGFKYTAENEWTGGKIYDPKNGKTYSCKIELENNNKLKVRGFIGVSFIGRSDKWTRQ